MFVVSSFIGIMFWLLPYHYSWELIGLGLVMVPWFFWLRLYQRLGTPYSCFQTLRQYDKHFQWKLKMGGLRGGLALAMAAAIPANKLKFEGCRSNGHYASSSPTLSFYSLNHSTRAHLSPLDTKKRSKPLEKKAKTNAKTITRIQSRKANRFMLACSVSNNGSYKKCSCVWFTEKNCGHHHLKLNGFAYI